MGILMIVGVVLSILVPNLIYKWILKGEERTITHREYVKVLLPAASIYMIPIIIIQVNFDRITHINTEVATTVAQCLFISFFRAAIPEEVMKFVFVQRLLRRYPDLRMKETVLLAGVIGIGFGTLEKLVLGGPALITNAFFPGHMLFQWLMGCYIYHALRAEGSQRKKLFIRSLSIPILVHGLWDSGLFIGDLFMDKPGELMSAIGAGIVFGMMLFYLIATVKAVRTVRRMA